MTKKEVQKRVLQNGKPLSLNKFSWNPKTKTFSSKENGLVLNFERVSGCTFTTGSGCTFTTGSGCTFTTGSDCTFKTWFGCTFKTGSGCTFKTGSGCTFKTGSGCTFKTGFGCTFTTGSDCTFKTWFGCTFKTGSGCTFKTGSGCTFKTGSGCTFTTGSGCKWVYAWGELNEPPIFFCGSMYTIGFLRPGWIKSGCIEKPLDWWKTNITRCAEENNYTKQQQDEYKFYIHCIAKWMKRCKVSQPAEAESE